jgi:hypothetical protein
MLKAKLPAREGWEFFEGKRLRREGNVSVASPRGFATVFCCQGVLNSSQSGGAHKREPFFLHGFVIYRIFATRIENLDFLHY